MISTIPEILDKASSVYPNKLAYKSMGKSLTYLELHNKSKALATYLLQHNVCKGDRVGILMNRCIETSIAIYGILRAGCVYVPIDPTSPKDRILFLIKDCNIKSIITVNSQSRVIGGINFENTSIVTIIGLKMDKRPKFVSWEVIFNQTDILASYPKLLAKDLAYIMYTSGSTGSPKGIMHTHSSCLAYAKLSKELYNVNTNDIIAGHAALHFDISTFTYFTAPLACATTIILSDAYTKMPVSLAQLIEQEKISIWYSAPQALIQLLNHGLLEERKIDTLHWVLFGGEVFPSKYLKKLVNLWPNAMYSNVYGPAEVNQCTYFNIDKKYEISKELPIGQVWNQTEYRILDINDNDVIDGEPGELVVRSDTMMKGYWNNPELSKKSFFTESKIPNFEYTYFRTGDVMRKDSNGDLIFIGRNDRQIKIRGYRVELDEIELQINKHASVIESCVIVDDNSDSGNKIIAAVILKDYEIKLNEEMTKHCAKALPHYAIPSEFLAMETLPRTSTDKINRNKLKDLIFN